MERDLYGEVTAQIVADLEKGALPWRKPWDSLDPVSSLPLRHNGQPYRGINILALWSKALSRNYQSPFGLTYKQAQTIGGQVRLGERGAIDAEADLSGNLARVLELVGDEAVSAGGKG